MVFARSGPTAAVTHVVEDGEGVVLGVRRVELLVPLVGRAWFRRSHATTAVTGRSPELALTRRPAHGSRRPADPSVPT